MFSSQRTSADKQTQADSSGTSGPPAARLFSNAERVQLARRLSDPGTAAPGSGRPLPAVVRETFERAYESDFGDVRVHEDGRAERVDAVAFTRGDHLHFRRGRYDPHSPRGRETIAHELAHVVQQRAGRVRPGDGSMINADRRLETEADRLATRATRGERATPHHTSSAHAGDRNFQSTAVSGGAIQRFSFWDDVKKHGWGYGIGAGLGMVGGGLLGSLVGPGAGTWTGGIVGGVIGGGIGAAIGRGISGLVGGGGAQEQQAAPHELRPLVAAQTARADLDEDHKAPALSAEEQHARAALIRTRQQMAQGWAQSHKPTERSLSAHANAATGTAVQFTNDTAVLGTDHAGAGANLLSPLVAQHTDRDGRMPLHMAAHLYNRGVGWSNGENQSFIDQIIGERRRVAVAHAQIVPFLSGVRIQLARTREDRAQRFAQNFDQRMQGDFGTHREVHALLAAGYTYDRTTGMLHPPAEDDDAKKKL